MQVASCGGQKSLPGNWPLAPNVKEDEEGTFLLVPWLVSFPRICYGPGSLPLTLWPGQNATIHPSTHCLPALPWAYLPLRRAAQGCSLGGAQVHGSLWSALAWGSKKGSPMTGNHPTGATAPRNMRSVSIKRWAGARRARVSGGHPCSHVQTGAMQTTGCPSPTRFLRRRS